MEDDNITPYETSPSLTVKQAVMYMFGYRGNYSIMGEGEEFGYDLYDYLYDLQEDADCAYNNACVELKLLNNSDNASPDAIKLAEENVDTTKAKLDKANNLPNLAEQYRRLINHEIKRTRLGKRNTLVLD